MSNKKAILGNGVVYLISTILIKGIVFLTMPLFTKLLSVEDFGIYNAYMSYEAVLSVIMAMGVPVVIRNAWIEYTKPFAAFERSMNKLLFTLFGGILVIILVVEFFSHGSISKLIGMNRALLICLLFHSSGYGLVIIETTKYKMEFKSLKVLLLSLAITVSSISVSLILIRYWQKGYTGRIVGAAFPYLIFWIYYWGHFLLNKERSDRKIYSYILALGIPSIPYILSENILLQSDRVMIERFIGSYAAGIYSAISIVATILMIVGTTFDDVWVPWSYRAISNNQTQKLKVSFTYYYLIYAGISVGFGMIAPELIQICTSKRDYWEFIWLIYPMLLMQFLYFTSRIPGNVLLYYKKTQYSACGLVLTATLNIFLNGLAFTRFGFETAAFTSLFCIAIFTAFQFAMCRYFKIDNYDINKLFVIWIGTTGIILLECRYLSNRIVRYGMGCLMVLLILALFTRKFKLLDFIGQLRKRG